MAMFNNSRGGRDAGASGSVPPSQSGGKRGMFSVIGPDVVITGNIAATADLHIDGRVEGDVHCGNLVQGSESHISGAVHAETARIAGSIEGSVAVRQLTVERAARISGDVEYESIAIETGAAVDGRLKHVSGDAVARRSAPIALPRSDDVVPITGHATA